MEDYGLYHPVGESLGKNVQENKPRIEERIALVNEQESSPRHEKRPVCVLGIVVHHPREHLCRYDDSDDGNDDRNQKV